MNPGVFILIVIMRLLNLYTYVILASALISWLFLPPTNSVVRFLRFLTEPVLAPCRKLLYRVLPFSWRRLDFSPVLALLLVQLVIYILGRVIQLVA
jgi:YggT family protein